MHLCQEIIQMYAIIVPHPTIKPSALLKHYMVRSLSDISNTKQHFTFYGIVFKDNMTDFYSDKINKND